MRLSGVEVGDPQRLVGQLANLTETLPAPDRVTSCELRSALAIYEGIVSTEERVLLVLVAIEADPRETNLLLMIVALMRHIAKKRDLTHSEIDRLVNCRRTIVGLVLET